MNTGVAGNSEWEEIKFEITVTLYAVPISELCFRNLKNSRFLCVVI
jgi:hypothetical protein